MYISASESDRTFIASYIKNEYGKKNTISSRKDGLIQAQIMLTLAQRKTGLRTFQKMHPITTSLGQQLQTDAQGCPQWWVKLAILPWEEPP